MLRRFSAIRRLPRITEGFWNFTKAYAEASHRGWTVHTGADEHWESQTVGRCYRKLLVVWPGVAYVNGRAVRMNNM